MTSIYLSSDNPRWVPRSEEDLQAAIDGGLFEENHHLDLKKAPGTKSDNRELARDLASFAIDGGTLVIGVQENKESRTFELSPQPLNGLPEKIESVARTIPDPPLTVTTEEITSKAADGTGYLIVHIPASPVAPHMVDNKYYGRGDKTKYQLGDAEVVSLHVRRRSAEADTMTLLRTEMDNDPLRNVDDQSHLFLVARPTAARRDVCLPITGAPEWQMRLTALITKARTSEALPTALTRFHPDLDYVHQPQRRARGVALASRGLNSDRTYTNEHPEWGDNSVIEVQLFEDGGLRLYMSRLSTGVSSRYQPEKGEEQMLFDGAAVLLTWRVLELMRLVSEEVGYHGNWAIGAGANRLHGRRRYGGESGFPTDDRYSDDTYEETTGTTLAELRDQPGTVTRRLLGPLLRSLGSEALFAEALGDRP
ncbi:MAG TPA: ATP-binding protein [Streptomyces sp.]|uniref:AlbA family DNA-binding domain-containing protein n=1 Tax=Streptomyces sp. TaxID=1931 RepID=UPI002C7C14D0|nr:ATP-binding protein [Streptomyces sp.]HWU05540.1 ATP-binding protein [Streptomyces sp.]